MANDYWPQEEGAIFDEAAYIIPCYPDDIILETSSVKIGTTVAGRISVTVSAAVGDGIGIALRAATAAGIPTRIPVLVAGICKVKDSGTLNYYLMAGSFAINSTTTTFKGVADAGCTFALLKAGGGASYIMGLCLQGVQGGTGDEILLLVGRTS
jgi:hypothetical protein